MVPVTYIEAGVRDQIRDGARRSAEVLASYLVEVLGLSGRMLDVGCGEGFLVAEFRSRGFEAHGVDGDDLPGVDKVRDLTRPLGITGFDVAVCLEVGEHLPDSAAETLVDSLCAAASIVVFSAAIPGQRGPGHINEQWPAYWVEKFGRRGLVGSGALRWPIWGDERVEPWYRQNLLVFGSELPDDGCPSVVHPDVWGWSR